MASDEACVHSKMLFETIVSRSNLHRKWYSIQFQRSQIRPICYSNAIQSGSNRLQSVHKIPVTKKTNEKKRREKNRKTHATLNTKQTNKLTLLTNAKATHKIIEKFMHEK